MIRSNSRISLEKNTFKQGKYFLKSSWIFPSRVKYSLLHMAASAGRFPGPVSSVVLRTSHLSAVSEGMEVSPPLQGYSWSDQLCPSDPSGPIRSHVPETESQGWWGNLKLWYLMSPTRTREANDGVCPCGKQSGPDGRQRAESAQVHAGNSDPCRAPTSIPPLAPGITWYPYNKCPSFYSRTSGSLLLCPMPHLRCPSSSLANTGC